MPNWSMIDDNKQLKKLEREKQIELLQVAHNALEKSSFTVDELQATLNQLLESTGEKPGTLFSLIRFALTWAPFSPGLPETMQVLGQERVMARLKKAIEAN
jgi:glutamyl/glutaminyl-tRNA synthetase